MSKIDLAYEHRASLAELRRRHAEDLIKLGVDPLLIAIYQLVGILKMRPTPGGLWEPCETGKLAFVTPVRVHDPLTPLAPDPWSAVRWGTVIDLVAWCPDRAEHYLLRTGEAAWIGAVPLPEAEPFPVHLRRSVFSWLCAGAEGLVLLTRDRHEKDRVVSALGNRAIAVEGEDRRRALAADLARARASLQPKLTLLRSKG